MKVSFTEWKIENYLKTPKERMAYLEAAMEDGTPDAIPDAFADIFRSLGMKKEAVACDGLAEYIRTTSKTISHRRKSRKELAMA